ncbi:MAG TPA: Mur ligase family protein, partial [Acidimicrobiales bacterium]|nr:Mur ligase family protein [Acidimicrobiales bacterium]
MRLDHLLDDVEVLDLHGDPATEVVDVTHDSAAVVPGSLFCCVPGHRVDGHDFAPAAVERGASALLCERVLPVDVPQVVVADARAAMAPAAASFWGHPSRSLDVVGITGTNGKTTTALLVQACLRGAGRPTEVIGTMTGARTTPEAPDLQRTLAGFRDRGIAAVAMEVSSVGLAQRRVDAVWFAAGVFTNLSPDELAFHGSVEAYFEAKASLFAADRCAVAVVNADDEFGRRILERAALPLRTFSLADAKDLELERGRASFTWRGRRTRLALDGAYNVENALAAAPAVAE